jgi:hypothetical protein
MIAIRCPPPPAQGQPLGRLKAYFMDFIREKDTTSGQIKLVPTAIENHSKNCYDCRGASKPGQFV